jgi:hypothetical protein
MFTRASINQYQCPDWEMIEVDYAEGKIVIYKGCYEVLKEIDVFAA